MKTVEMSDKDHATVMRFMKDYSLPLSVQSVDYEGDYLRDSANGFVDLDDIVELVHCLRSILKYSTRAGDVKG